MDRTCGNCVYFDTADMRECDPRVWSGLVWHKCRATGRYDVTEDTEPNPYFECFKDCRFQAAQSEQLSLF